ncbi:TldD/PmbA family protein [Kosmotoga pacifica]|uniref:Peptidase U62 n=1 Tax=Kosmotoga pacifica TaxID=1330330 RepID=A0A0G2Z6J1_9BACT|nr:TldD/PmbA family protein [Kosmotoga pacifica]AKI97172.1 hypothetical protein IX53_04370 [Kosmotoga pacifica]
MTFEKFREMVFEYAAAKKANDFEIYIKKTREFDVSIQKGEIEKYKDATTVGVSFKVLKDGKVGYSFSETLNEQAVKLLVDEALENVTVIESEEQDFLYDGSGEYASFNTLYLGEFDRLTAREKIEIAMELEKSVLASRPEIFMVPYNGFSHKTSEIYIANSSGMEVYSKSDGGHIFAMALGKRNDSPKSVFYFKVGKKPQDLGLSDITTRISRDMELLFTAKPVKSGKYAVIFRNDAFGSLLSTFSPMFSAKSVQKGFSLLKGRLGEKIASEKLTLIDDPFLEMSPVSRTFDDQGVPTRRKAIIEKGELKTYLYDLKTARIDNRESTGNALKLGNYRVPTSISHFNLVLENEGVSFEDMVKTIERGLVIIELDGLHSGANPISGDFSLGARGFLVEKGRIVGGVEEITVSGNILNVLKNIVETGNDAKFSMPGMAGFSSYAFLPSVLVEGVDVAGL